MPSIFEGHPAYLQKPLLAFERQQADERLCTDLLPDSAVPERRDDLTRRDEAKNNNTESMQYIQRRKKQQDSVTCCDAVCISAKASCEGESQVAVANAAN